LTDGNVRFGSRTYRIVYAGKSDELHQIFRKLMNNIFGLENFYEYTDKKGVKTTTYSSKIIGEYLINTCGTFKKAQSRTNPKDYPKINLKIFYEITTQELKEVFRLMFSADGGVVMGVKWHKRYNKWELTRRIILKCSHPGMRKVYRYLLKERLEINTKEWDSSIAIDTKDDLFRFAKEISFVKNVKVSKKSLYWQGYNKNNILSILIKTYKIKPERLKSFKMQNDVISNKPKNYWFEPADGCRALME